MEFLRKIAGVFNGAPRNTNLGRNDPCWCDSGKKYKRCHLDDDRRKLQARPKR